MWLRSCPNTIRVMFDTTERMRELTAAGRDVFLWDQAVFNTMGQKHGLRAFCVAAHNDGTKCHEDTWRGNMTKGLVYSLHATCVRGPSKQQWFMKLRTWLRVPPYVRRKAPDDVVWHDKGFVMKGGVPRAMGDVAWVKPPGR